MSTTRRSEARTKGLRLAARVATVGGVAIAAFGLAQASAAGAASATSTDHSQPTASDDAKPLPMEDWAKAGRAGGGNCGCSPCWGPPAPPALGVA